MKRDTNGAHFEAEIARLKSEHASEVAKLKSEIGRLELLNKWYEEQFKLARHRQFGRSSEKADAPEQLGLFNEAEGVANPHVPEPTIEEITYTRKKKRRGKREEFFEGLPTEQIIHELPDDERVCPVCQGELHACGHAVLRRELEIIPAKVRAVEHVQTVYSCRDCERKTMDSSDKPNNENELDVPAVPMVKAAVPAPVIPGSGIASASLISFILCNKYLLALPLNRQEQEFQRLGINISKQTMANWMIYSSSHWLILIYNLLKEALVTRDILHSDDTSLQVIKENGRKASQKSHMWIYRTAAFDPEAIVLFDYQQTQAAEHPLRFLSGFKGYLHTDGYQGYKHLQAQGVTIVECWFHARRKFHDALKVLAAADRSCAAANIGYGYCNRLSELEKQYDKEGLSPEERFARRLKESKPIAEEFFAWAESERKALVQTKSLFAAAIIYAVNQKEWLLNIYLDARLSISNNLAERSIRPFTVGRNNWLFSYSAKGAKSSAVAYSVVETAKANGLVPYSYIKYLLEALPNLPSERYNECLPWKDKVKQLCSITNK
jgi:transposase